MKVVPQTEQLAWNTRRQQFNLRQRKALAGGLLVAKQLSNVDVHGILGQLAEADLAFLNKSEPVLHRTFHAFSAINERINRIKTTLKDQNVSPPSSLKTYATLVPDFGSSNVCVWLQPSANELGLAVPRRKAPHAR